MGCLIGIFAMASLLLVLMDSLWGTTLVVKIRRILRQFIIQTRYLLQCAAAICKNAWNHSKIILSLLFFKDHSKTHQG